MKSRLIIAGAGVLAAAGAFTLLTSIRLHAQPQELPLLRSFTISGFQESPSAPFILEGVPIADYGVWQSLGDPVLGYVFAVIPPASGSGFNGAGCQAEHSEGQIMAQGGAVTLEVTGFRCTPNTDPGFLKTGVYNVKSATGLFSNLLGGTGTISLDHRPDGSALLSATGSWNFGAPRVHN